MGRISRQASLPPVRHPTHSSEPLLKLAVGNCRKRKEEKISVSWEQREKNMLLNQPSLLFIFDFTGNHGKPEPNLVPSCVLQSLTTAQTETEELKWKKALSIKGDISLAQLALEKALPEMFRRDPAPNMKWPVGLGRLCSTVC